MDKKHECIICKHYGIRTSEVEILEKNHIFDDSGLPVPISLCRKHAVELFKQGQKIFLLSHYKILVDLVASDDTKFLEVLEKTIKKHPNRIF